ncbi:hypothetical protein D3C81_1759290 [compost metagenome]
MIDIQQQNEMLSLLKRRQILQPALQATAVIQAGQRVHHAQIVKRFPLLKQSVQQVLSKTVVTSLNHVMDCNPNHRQREGVNDAWPVLGRAKPQTDQKCR